MCSLITVCVCVCRNKQKKTELCQMFHCVWLRDGLKQRDKAGGLSWKTVWHAESQKHKFWLCEDAQKEKIRIEKNLPLAHYTSFPLVSDLDTFAKLIKVDLHRSLMVFQLEPIVFCTWPLNHFTLLHIVFISNSSMLNVTVYVRIHVMQCFYSL